MADKEARESEAWQERFMPGAGQPWPTAHDLLELISIRGEKWWWRCRCGATGAHDLRTEAIAEHRTHVENAEREED